MPLYKLQLLSLKAMCVFNCSNVFVLVVFFPLALVGVITRIVVMHRIDRITLLLLLNKKPVHFD